LVEKNDEEMTTIAVSVGVKDELEELKVHPAQPYNEVLIKLLRFFDEKGGKHDNR